MSIRDEIRSFVVALLERRGDKQPFSDSDSLLLRGRMDSVDVLELVEHLEEKHQVDFAVRGFHQDDFDSVDTIVGLLEKNES